MLATNIGTGLIVGQFGMGVIDGNDLDREPEVVPLAGTITFTPSVPYLPNATAAPNPITIVTAPIKGVLDEEGYLCTPGPDGITPLYRGVRLFATDDEDMGVRNWTYSVVYRFGVVNGVTPAVKAHSISLPEGTEVDLTKVVEVPSSPGVGTPQALALLALAEAAASTAADNSAIALQVKADADAGLFIGEPGPAGPNTIPTDTAIATNIQTPGTETAAALNATILNNAPAIVAPSVGTLVTSQVPPLVAASLASNAAPAAAAEAAVANAVAGLSLVSSKDPRIPTTANGEGFRVRDNQGRVALQVTEIGDVKAGSSGLRDSQPGDKASFRVRDDSGSVAFETGPNGAKIPGMPGTAMRTQAPGTLVATPQPSNGGTAKWLDRNRTRLYGKGVPNGLVYSEDDGATWVPVTSFPDPSTIDVIRDLDNGELLVSAGYIPNAVYVSKGFSADPQTATWTKVLEAHGTRAGTPYFANSWSCTVTGNIVVINEYGTQTLGADNPRYTHLSIDYGKTWKMIFDLGTAMSQHLHGVAYDPYWDRIWLTQGDDPAGSSIRYSDDLGETWNIAYKDPAGKGWFQSVGIVVLPNCVLFLSDSQPNGIHRIPRSAGKYAGTYTPEVAYALDGEGKLTWLGHLGFQARRPGNDAPALFPFAPENTTAASRLIATMDGYTFQEIWRDTIETTSMGIASAFGPTVRGNLIITSNDARTAGVATKWVGKMPIGY